MKKAILFFICAALSLGVCGCKKTEPGLEAQGPTEQPEAKGEAALLPDWPSDGEDGGWVTYRHITPKELRGYTDSLEKAGFTLIENAEGRWAKILYRDDAWVEISDNTDSYGCCSVKATLNRSSGGMSCEQAGAVTAHYSAVKDGEACAVIEVTPEGIYEATGFQLFRVLCDGRPKPEGTDPVFSTATYIVGGERAREIFLCDIAAADIDGDGETEAVVLEYGPTSGIFTLLATVFGRDEGGLHLEASSMFRLDFGLCSLSVHDGNAYLVREAQHLWPQTNEVTFDAPKEYRLSVESGLVTIDDPDGELGMDR